MDEHLDDEGGGRQLDATAANRMAQEINDRAQGTNLAAKFGDGENANPPPDSGGTPGADLTQGRGGDNPVESQVTEDQAGVFPSDSRPTIDVTGSPEEQRALRDEYTGR